MLTPYSMLLSPRNLHPKLFKKHKLVRSVTRDVLKKGKVAFFFPQTRGERLRVLSSLAEGPISNHVFDQGSYVRLGQRFSRPDVAHFERLTHNLCGYLPLNR